MKLSLPPIYPLATVATIRVLIHMFSALRAPPIFLVAIIRSVVILTVIIWFAKSTYGFSAVLADHSTVKTAFPCHLVYISVFVFFPAVPSILD